MDPQTFQVVVLAFNGLMGVALLLGGLFLRRVEYTINKMSEDLGTLKDKVLESYATKYEVENVEKYVHKAVHELWGEIQKHEVWAQLLAKHANYDLPRIP